MSLRHRCSNSATQENRLLHSDVVYGGWKRPSVGHQWACARRNAPRDERRIQWLHPWPDSKVATIRRLGGEWNWTCALWHGCSLFCEEELTSSGNGYTSRQGQPCTFPFDFFPVQCGLLDDLLLRDNYISLSSTHIKAHIETLPIHSYSRWVKHDKVGHSGERRIQEKPG